MTSSCASCAFLRSRLESQSWNSFNSFPIVNGPINAWDDTQIWLGDLHFVFSPVEIFLDLVATMGFELYRCDLVIRVQVFVALINLSTFLGPRLWAISVAFRGKKIIPHSNGVSADVPTPPDSGKTPQLKTSNLTQNCGKTEILHLQPSYGICWSHEIEILPQCK